MVGDIHQPMHVTSRCTKSDLWCDGGGNGFRINAGYKTQNLHALWDQAMTKIPFKARPLSKSSIDIYKDFAKEIAAEYPRDTFAQELRVTDPWDIAEEGLNIAIEYAYTDIYENEEPSDEYLETRYEICKQKIALAG